MDSSLCLHKRTTSSMKAILALEGLRSVVHSKPASSGGGQKQKPTEAQNGSDGLTTINFNF